MAVLPWGSNRTRADSNGEKNRTVTLDWFSRSATEPSRQAISDLIRQHSRGSSGGSGSLRSRSRASTPSSQHRSGASVDSRAGSSHTPERSIASRSRPATPSRPNTSSVDQPESATKSLFQRSGLLRRKGSKMSITLDTELAAGVVSPPRPSSSRAGLRGRESNTTSPSTDAPRPSISRPFDFAHVMHGDLNKFSGLERIDEFELASQFDAIQARYRTTKELGVSPSNAPVQVTPITDAGVTSNSPNEIGLGQVALPNSPPRPAPPPKDSEPIYALPHIDMRTSRSTENFSRPTPRSPITPSSTAPFNLSPSRAQPLPSAVVVGDLVEGVTTKPLPQLPTLVHAVSTQDDTARLLITAPLPSPPIDAETKSPRHHRQSSSKSSLRHMSTFPSARNGQLGGFGHGDALLGIREEDNLIRPQSDHELSQRLYRQPAGRVSLQKKQLVADEWDEVIESAWDLEDDDGNEESRQAPYRSSVHSSARESYLTIEQPAQEAVSSPSTPLMTMAPAQHLRQHTASEPSSTPVEDAHLVTQGDGTALFGLGIETNNHTSFNTHGSRRSGSEVSMHDTKRPVNVSRLPRSAYSAVSNASSQESIILSIASSIMGTQRSSISSVSVSDYSQPSKPERTSIPKAAVSPLLNVEAQHKAARPESGCLPPALLRQMNLEMQKAARRNSNPATSSPDSKTDSSSSKPNKRESSCFSSEMLATFPIPEAMVENSDQSETNEDSVSELPNGEHHSRTTSASRMVTPGRASSSSVGESTFTGRQRSNTAGTRMRTGRVSYSLFPTANSTSSISPSLDMEEIAS